MTETLSDTTAHLLVQGGVKRLYCPAGDRNTLLPAAARREPALRCLLVCHAETAAFAAAAEAQLTGQVSACCGSGASAVLSLLRGLCEARRSGAPVLALVQRSPADEDGGQMFPAAALFRHVGADCFRVHAPGQAVAAVLAALRTARARRGPAVAELPQAALAAPAEAPALVGDLFPAPSAAACPSGDSLLRMAELINGAARVTFLCGIGCAGAKQDVVALARRVQAPVAYTLRAKDVMEGDNPCEVGMAGPMGWGGAPVAVADCDLLIMWGTDFPFEAALPAHTAVVQVDTDAAALGRRVPLALGVHGDVKEVARALLPLIRRDRGDEHLCAARCRHRRCVAAMEQPVRAPEGGDSSLRAEYLTRLVSDLAEPDAVFTAESGEPLLWAARYLRTADARRLLGSFRLAADSCALAMALGAKAAFPSRQVIALCHAEGLSRLSGLLRTLREEHLAVKILVYNRAREGGDAKARPDFAALAQSMGITAEHIGTEDHAGAAVKRWLACPAAALLDAAVER